MPSINRIERVLALIKLLKKYTDEDNSITVSDLLERLNDKLGEDADIPRHSVVQDLNMLQSSRFIEIDVIDEGEGLPKYYSYQGIFEIQEVRLLMDAISSARFITLKDKETILSKIKQLTSNSTADNLEKQIVVNNTAIKEAELVKYSIFNLYNAIHENKIVRFKYGRYNVKKEFVLSHKGKERELHPYGLIWNNDYYYLIGKNIEKNEMRHFRVDRMVQVEVMDQTFIKDHSFKLSDYTSKLFHMYSGPEKDLKVRFDNHLINVIIDRFGKDVSIEEDGEHTFILRTKAVMSDGLVRWLLTWGSDAEVIDPQELVAKLKEESAKMYRIYNSKQGP